MNFFLYPFSHLPIVSFFSDFFASLVLRIKIFHDGKITFSSFHFLAFILMFPVLLLSLLMFCQEDLMGRGTKHVIKRNHWRQWWEMATKVWKKKKVPCCFFFVWAWPKVWVDGPESKKENAPADHFSARFGSNSVFLVIELTCVWHRQPAGHPPVNAQHHLLVVLLFSLQFYSLSVYPLSSTRGKTLLQRLGNLRRWSCT